MVEALFSPFHPSPLAALSQLAILSMDRLCCNEEFEMIVILNPSLAVILKESSD